MTLYTTLGLVRGGCAHVHRTIHAAQRCLARDQRACRSIPGGAHYSDRAVYAYDGANAVPVLLISPRHARSRHGFILDVELVALEKCP